MLGRLLIGIVKGLIVGSLVGFGLVKLGMPMPGAVMAYLSAAVTGVLIGLIAGKPIWAKDAKIEAGMKAFVGALLASGLMYVARRWLQVSLPFSIGTLTPDGATLGGFAMTSLGAVAGLLGGFYEADNDPSEPEAAPAESAKAKTGKNQQRIAAEKLLEETDDELDDETDKKRSKK